MRNIVASGMLYGKHITVNQISKPKALKLFCSGETIYMQSSNMRPFGIWQSLCTLSLDIDMLDNDINHYNFCKSINSTPLPMEPTKANQFEQQCNNYIYYNCCSERGKYINFYQIVK